MRRSFFTHIIEVYVVKSKLTSLNVVSALEKYDRKKVLLNYLC